VSKPYRQGDAAGLEFQKGILATYRNKRTILSFFGQIGRLAHPDADSSRLQPPLLCCACSARELDAGADLQVQAGTSLGIAQVAETRSAAADAPPKYRRGPVPCGRAVAMGRGPVHEEHDGGQERRRDQHRWPGQAPWTSYGAHTAVPDGQSRGRHRRSAAWPCPRSRRSVPHRPNNLYDGALDVVLAPFSRRLCRTTGDPKSVSRLVRRSFLRPR
jgi:hypothetical protein